MNDIAASIGLGNLEDFNWILTRRREIVAIYRDMLDDVPGVTLFERSSDRESADWGNFLLTITTILLFPTSLFLNPNPAPTTFGRARTSSTASLNILLVRLSISFLLKF